jgi:hypothetical protein
VDRGIAPFLGIGTSGGRALTGFFAWGVGEIFLAGKGHGDGALVRWHFLGWKLQFLMCVYLTALCVSKSDSLLATPAS